MIGGLAMLIGGLLTSGCGAANPQLTAKLERTKLDIDTLRQAYQAQNHRLEVVQDRMALMEDRLETALLRQMSTAKLPVVRLEPQITAGPPIATINAATGPVRSLTQADMDGLSGPPRRRKRAPRRAVTPPMNAANAGNIGVAEVAPVPSGGVVLRKNRPALSRADDPISAYKRASRLQQSGDLAKAIDAFGAFVKQHPDHGYADNALFRLGEAKYAQVQYGAALDAFRRLVRSYPDGNMVPDALLMIGKTQDKLGRPAQGRETLARLMTMFPSTAAARKAAKVLSAQGRM